MAQRMQSRRVGCAQNALTSNVSLHVIRLHMQVYRQVVTIRNNLNATVEASLRPGSPERWTLAPVSILLPPKQSVDVQLRLRVLRFAQRRKAQEHGQRDVFHIKACGYQAHLGRCHFVHSVGQRAATTMHAELHACTGALQAAYFEQKFVATFFLAPSEGQGAADAAQQVVPRPQRPPSRMGPSRGLLLSSGVRLAPQPDSSALAQPEPSNADFRSQGTAAAPCTQIAAMQPEAGHLMEHAMANEDVSSLGSCLSDCGLSDEEGSINSNQQPQQAAGKLAASQHVRALKDQLAAAAAREALLQDSLAAREDTIRYCFMQQEHVLCKRHQVPDIERASHGITSGDREPLVTAWLATCAGRRMACWRCCNRGQSCRLRAVTLAPCYLCPSMMTVEVQTSRRTLLLRTQPPAAVLWSSRGLWKVSRWAQVVGTTDISMQLRHVLARLTPSL